MKEESYKCRCPVHGQILITKKIRTYKTKSGEKYTKPFFYCSKCNVYYMIIDELGIGYKRTLTDNNGLPVHILGKQDNEKTQQIPENSKAKRSDKDGPKKDEKSNEEIIKIATNVIASGAKLPLNCPYCHKRTVLYSIPVGKNTDKSITGKRCKTCEENFFMESTVEQYKEYFNVNGGDETSAVFSKKAEKKVRALLSTYCNTKNNEAKNELLQLNYDITPLLKTVLGEVNGTEQKRLLYIAVRKNPQVFLPEVIKRYGDDVKEYRSVVTNIDFRSGSFHNAALNLVNEISPYPGIVLNELPNDPELQSLIAKEIQSGIAQLRYIKYVASNPNIIFEDWMQEMLLEKASKCNNWLPYVPYISLNTEHGIRYVNKIKDIALLYFILKTNLWGISTENSPRLAENPKIVSEYIKTADHKAKEIMVQYVEKKLINPDTIPSVISEDVDYIKLFLNLVNGLHVQKLIDDCYDMLLGKGISPNAYKDIFVAGKSQKMLKDLLDSIPDSDLTNKHKTAKIILTKYTDPDSLVQLKRVVENTGIEKYIQNIKKMVASANLVWPKDSPDSEIAIASSSNPKIPAEKRFTGKISRNNDNPVQLAFIDDFGKEFDFSEFETILIFG